MTDECEVFKEEKLKNPVNNIQTNKTALSLTRFMVAPMLDWTDRHCRYFLRLMSRYAGLYTEMVTTGAVLRGDRDRHLRFNLEEKPLALQLGGSDPVSLAACAVIGEDYGYDEINLNIGCPSARVQSGKFGACLMKEPALVGDCVQAMRAAVKIPVTIKTRIGVDTHDSEAHLHAFIDTVSQAGCQKFIIHARKAWLKGLSPKENREIPPLRYEAVSILQQRFPELVFILNGGIKNLAEAQCHLENFSGVMLGRAVSHNPYLLSQVDQKFFNVTQKENLSREVLIDLYKIYIKKQLLLGVPLSVLLHPLMGLYQGQANAKKWRKIIALKQLEI